VKKTVIAMSGGVDSATAAAILARNGLSLTGVTMQLWDDGSHCVSRQHMEDAKKVADLLGIPHHVLDVHEEFRREVVDPSVEQYKNGRTPNPCVVCNQRVKMRTLLRYASEQQIQYVATGHYARTEHDGSRQRFLLKRGEDRGLFFFFVSLVFLFGIEDDIAEEAIDRAGCPEKIVCF